MGVLIPMAFLGSWRRQRPCAFPAGWSSDLLRTAVCSDMLSHQVDDVTDKIEEILQKFFIYNIQTIDPSAVVFAKNIVRSCELLCALMEEFENFKRSKKIHGLIVELNDVEEECDKLYLTSMRDLTRNSADALAVISWLGIYDCLEACADACEHVSECVGTVIMKNT